MADVFSVEKRSEIMSRIRSQSALETAFCKKLSAVVYKKGFRYRRNYKKLPGKPDVAFVGAKLAVFIDGDFWHGYDFRKRSKKLPAKYWLPKIKANIARDKKHNAELKKIGWRVRRYWEHEVRKNPNAVVDKILRDLKKPRR